MKVCGTFWKHQPRYKAISLIIYYILHPIYYTFAIFTDRTTSDEKIEVAHVRLQDYIRFELDRRMTPPKTCIPKVLTSKSRGGRKPWYRGWYRANLHPPRPHKAISRAKLPFRTANHLELFIVIYLSSGISIRVRKDADRNWLFEKKSCLIVREIETPRLTLSARLLLPFSSRQKWAARNDW